MSEGTESFDRLFDSFVIGNASLEKLWTGARWAEGPVWFGDAGCLLFSDIPNDRMLRWVEGGPVTVFRQPANYTNGHYRDGQGRLISCEHGERRVTRTEVDRLDHGRGRSLQGRSAELTQRRGREVGR